MTFKTGGEEEALTTSMELYRVCRHLKDFGPRPRFDERDDMKQDLLTGSPFAEPDTHLLSCMFDQRITTAQHWGVQHI
jgi:hypothetical protein